MTTDQIKAIQAKIGTAPDGFWGPQSIAKCQSYLRRIGPFPSPWPATDQASLTKFYGEAGQESKLVNLPVGHLPVFYEGDPVRTIRCHVAAAASLGRILAAIAASPHADILAKYAGCYDNRPMRNGSSPSLHARGAAIDLDPDPNGNSTHWPAAATMPLEVMECFAREGWLPAGAFWGRDAMHAQATR